MLAIQDPVLVRFRAALAVTYGEKLTRTVLFGSRARGDAHVSSDYDVAVFLTGMDGFGVEAARLAAIETDILLETGAVINAIPFAAGAYTERTPLMAEVRRDGRDL